MYYLALGPVIYAQPLTLVAAMRQAYGVGQARIVRQDGTVAVRNAGSSYAVEHAPTGRTIVRRPARHLNRKAAA